MKDVSTITRTPTKTTGARGRSDPRRRTELTAFLRSRRAKVTPEDVGMPGGLRRRTPGLRREEVAQLSGVGVTWYTWLEQGRPINASVQVLDAVARTLRLDTTEREHLYHLAEVPYVPARQADPQHIGPEVESIIRTLDPLPAAVYNAKFDILASNTAYTHVLPGADHPDPAERNMLWRLFGSVPPCCCAMVDPQQELATAVATLRGGYGRHVGEPAWESLIQRLSDASPDFKRLWASCDVAPPGANLKMMWHAEVGELWLTSTSLEISSVPEARIVVYTPYSEHTEALLAKLRTIEDPIVGCPDHARPLSEIRAERRAGRRS
ncbi:helix-turn-helix transcriptional regulator [Streptomyces albiaxialis]|uniref:Helix-turn-helix transcriptional regulator n=1 Tax=Streptomyces albiaxialis TaxID=329523 RepID=A0ABN2WEH9_9ACTN